MNYISNIDIQTRLAEIVGTGSIINEPESLTFFSTDLEGSGVTTSAVVRVASTEELSRVLTVCDVLNYVAIPRGGGFSYTGGYTPVAQNSITIDLRGIDQIYEINEDDMYVRVGCGCTWRNLYEALKAKGFRTPYYGPMSGYNATIGGALSQGSFFLGSTEYGTIAESVLSLEMVLANGDVIHTGSDSAKGTAPFYRNYGPDLTGLFVADTGALGFKAVATLKLIRFPQHQAYGSFAFETGEQTVAALSEIGRAGLAAEAYAWDPYFVKVMSEASVSTGQDIQFLWGAIRNGAGLIDGLSAGLRIALAGKKVFKPGTHIIQIMIDDHSAAGAAQRLKQVRKIAMANGATELAPSIPRATRGTPFTNFNVAERRTTLRNLPTNALFTHSRAPAALEAMRALFEEHKASIKQYGMEIGLVFFAVGKNAMAIEPLFYWHDPQQYLHNRIEQRSDLDALVGFVDRPDATTFAHELRSQLKAVMQEHGAVHVQIGKAYNYLDTRELRLAQLLKDIKTSVDPKNHINPGSLGLK